VPGLGRVAARGLALMSFLRRHPGAIVFCVAFLWLVALEEFFRKDAADGLYFHAWTSEYMMQTVSLGDLRAEPFKSLWYNHIQPPVFDSIRAVLAARHPAVSGEALIRSVDGDLYGLWMLAYAAMAVLVFSWISQIRGRASATLAAVVFLFLPGPIFYSTFLDTTLLSSTLILWFLFSLWRVGVTGQADGQLVASSLVLFFTRSVFQWPFLIVLGSSLWLLRVPKARAIRMLVPISAVVLLFIVKQYVLFGLTTSSSFGPDSFCKGLSEYCHGTTAVPLPKTTDRYNAFVLRRAEKLNGEYNYNQEAFLKRSFSQMEEYKALLRRLTPRRVIELLKINLDFYLRPTSRHSAHAIVDRLVWRRPLEFILSGWAFVVLLAFAIAAWFSRSWKQGDGARSRSLSRGLGLALPVLYVAAVTIVFESGENMRYRFFLEPSLFVFLWVTLSPTRVGRPSSGDSREAAASA
jgi:hypothetical protein